MAAWLKAAEDLFEVVDRRAKLVVGEKDETPNVLSVPKASNGQGSQAKRTRQKIKKRLSSDGAPARIDMEKDQPSQETILSDVASDKQKPVALTENNDTGPSHPAKEINNQGQLSVDEGSMILESSSAGMVSTDDAKRDAAHAEAVGTINRTESADLKADGKLTSENLLDVIQGTPTVANKVAEVISEEASTDSNQTTSPGDKSAPKSVGQEETQVLNAVTPPRADSQPKGGNSAVETTDESKDPGEQKTVTSPKKVQEQLDEAQGLLRTAISTGQSKEARLARVCAGLSSRLQEYKSENAQLEELLIAERELSKSYEAHMKQLQKDLSAAKLEVGKVESNMAEALAAKNAELEALVTSVDVIKKQAAASEGNLASLQANMESIIRNRELTETRMMQALREELAAAERRAEEERAAHNATKMAAMEREVELEHRAIEASTALARIQRTADERTTKAAELEQKVALLEVECASLNQELQDMEARARRGQKKSPEDANQVIQMQAWQEEVERARQGQREAEGRLSSMEAEMQKLRVEMAAMKRDAEHYSRQEHMELEKRYRELTDLLYYKQTQLEAMASEKAAAEFQLEKEVKRLHDAQVEAERSRASRRGPSSWEEDTDMKALETLPLHQRHMAGASIQLQKAAKLLDSGAARATRFLWRYPIARVFLLIYLVFVHFFLMYLLHRLQEQADVYSSREVAESMGLGNQTLP